MKQEFENVADAVRVEIEEMTGEMYLVFKVTNEKYKQLIKTNWAEDIEFRVIDKKLVLPRS